MASTTVDWTDHGKDVPGAEYIWLVMMGQGVPAKGVVKNENIRQMQVAATIARLIGEDFSKGSPKAGEPIDFAK